LICNVGALEETRDGIGVGESIGALVGSEVGRVGKGDGAREGRRVETAIDRDDASTETIELRPEFRLTENEGLVSPTDIVEVMSLELVDEESTITSKVTIHIYETRCRL